MNNLLPVAEALISWMNSAIVVYLGGTFLTVFFALKVVKRLVRMLDTL